jgi:hypothetical protein
MGFGPTGLKMVLASAVATFYPDGYSDAVLVGWVVFQGYLIALPVIYFSVSP